MKSGYKDVYFGDNISICDKIKHKCEEIFRDMINKTLSKQSYNHLLVSITKKKEIYHLLKLIFQ